MKCCIYNFRHFITIPNLRIIILSLIYGKVNHTLAFQAEWLQGQYLKIQACVNNIINKSIRRKILAKYTKRKFINNKSYLQAISRAINRSNELKSLGKTSLKNIASKVLSNSLAGKSGVRGYKLKSKNKKNKKK